MLESRREEFRDRPVAVRASGLTKAIERGKRTRGLLGALNVIGGNPILSQAFQQDYSIPKTVKVILEDMGVNIADIKITPEDKLKRIDEAARAKTKTQIAERFGGAAEAAGGLPQTSQNQGGIDPAAPGVPEGLSGEIL